MWLGFGGILTAAFTATMIKPQNYSQIAISTFSLGTLLIVSYYIYTVRIFDAVSYLNKVIRQREQAIIRLGNLRDELGFQTYLDQDDYNRNKKRNNKKWADERHIHETVDYELWKTVPGLAKIFPIVAGILLISAVGAIVFIGKNSA